MSQTAHLWVLYDWEKDEEVRKYRTLHDAMEALSLRQGPWLINWSKMWVMKGNYRVSRIESA